MPPLFILFDEGAAAVFSTGTVFVVGVIRLTLSGSYQRSSPRFVLRAAAECLLLDDAQRACSLGRPDRHPVRPGAGLAGRGRPFRLRGHEGGSTATLVLRYIRKVRHRTPLASSRGSR